MVKLKGCPSSFTVCLRCGHDDRGPIASTGLCPRCSGVPAATAPPDVVWGVQSWSVFHTVQARGGTHGRRVQLGTYESREQAEQACHELVEQLQKRQQCKVMAQSYGYMVRLSTMELHYYSVQIGVRDRQPGSRKVGR